MTPINGEWTCVNCGETKPLKDATGKHNYTPYPKGEGYSASCIVCQAANRALTRAGLNDSPSTPASRDWIIKELKANYKDSTRTGDKIRCLETIAKLLTKEESTPVDDAAVVRSLMDSMRERKKKVTPIAKETSVVPSADDVVQ